jgi:8-oxo-dGTP diphosphatase
VFDVSVVYLCRGENSRGEILLGQKLTGLGRGKIVGPGGKLEAGESPADAAVREVAEEVGIVIGPKNLTHIATITYRFIDRPTLSQRSHAYLVTEFSGEPVASNELAPRWWPRDELPLPRMWADATLWLPRALSGEYVCATIDIDPHDDVHTAYFEWSSLSLD